MSVEKFHKLLGELTGSSNSTMRGFGQQMREALEGVTLAEVSDDPSFDTLEASEAEEPPTTEPEAETEPEYGEPSAPEEGAKQPEPEAPKDPGRPPGFGQGM